MAADLKGAPEEGLPSLVGGVIADVQDLIKQHLDMFHQEIQEDFRKTKEAVLAVGLGAGLGAAAGALLLVTLVGLLSWAVPAVPWWGWCGILGGALALAAAGFYHAGKKKFASFNPLPDESAAALKESVGQIADRYTSEKNQGRPPE